MENKFGRTSKLTLKTREKEGKTILDDVYFTSPFKIMNPFEQKDGSIQVMMMTASAGIMAGDVQEFDFAIGSHTKMEFLSQSFEKIHRMTEGQAKRYTKVEVAPEGTFLFHPQPTIPFEDSAFTNVMDIHLADESSVFTMQEIISCGRAARGERFLYHFYDSLVTIYQGEEMIYRDNTRFRPELMSLEDMGMFEGFTHMANVVICNQGKDKAWMEQVWDYLDEQEDVQGGVTSLEHDVVVVRILGKQAQKLQKLCDEILNME